MQNGNGKCGAKTRNGTPCKNAAMSNGRCRMHGGTQKRGVAHHSTKHGRYSKDLPARLQGNFEAAMSDSQLGNLRSEIALLDIRISELIGKLDKTPYNEVWSRLKEIRGTLKAAMRSGDSARTLSSLTELDNIIDGNSDDSHLWGEITSLIEQRRKVVDSERKRLVDLNQMITTDRAMLLVAALVGIVKEHVSDRQKLAAISTDVGKLINIEDDAIFVKR